MVMNGPKTATIHLNRFGLVEEANQHAPTPSYQTDQISVFGFSACHLITQLLSLNPIFPNLPSIILVCVWAWLCFLVCRPIQEEAFSFPGFQHACLPSSRVPTPATPVPKLPTGRLDGLDIPHSLPSPYPTLASQPVHIGFDFVFFYPDSLRPTQHANCQLLLV